jgi:hypothetical protein
MKLNKSLGWPLLLAGGALGWWWWRGRTAGGGKNPDAADAEKGIQIGQAGSNIGLTGDQVGTLFERLLDQSKPYDQVRIVKDVEGNRRKYQVRYGGEGDWITAEEENETRPARSITEICATLGLNCRP